MVIKAMRGQRGEYYIQYYSLWNDTSWFYLISEAGVILTSVAAVIVVVVEVIDAGSSGRGRWRLSRHQ
jgi:hypothetical protein